jgi:hypothetical protein
MPDQLATNTDLVVWLDIPTLTMPTDRAEEALHVATGWVQSYTQQKLVPVTGDVVTLDVPPNTRELWLPERPVTAVTSVTILGVPLVSGTDSTLIGASRLRAKRWTYWPTDDPVVVTYNHGYATADQTLRGVVLSAAARIINNPASMRGENVGSVSWQAAGVGRDTGTAGLLLSEQAALAPYRAAEAIA